MPSGVGKGDSMGCLRDKQGVDEVGEIEKKVAWDCTPLQPEK